MLQFLLKMFNIDIFAYRYMYTIKVHILLYILKKKCDFFIEKWVVFDECIYIIDE